MNSLPQPSKDSLGDRMKDYEKQYRMILPARSWTMIRLDGRAFHTWCRGLPRPYSVDMIEAFADAMVKMCQEIPGAVCAYQQSDELSILLQDFSKEDTQPWYGGQSLKIATVAASMLTAYFGAHFPERAPALFDARVFSLPNRGEVANALYWRQIDAKKNAISMIASSMYSARELHGKSTIERRAMLESKGWVADDADQRFLHGQFAWPDIEIKTSYVDRRTNQTIQLPKPVNSRVWKVVPAPELNAQPDGLLLNGFLPEAP